MEGQEYMAKMEDSLQPQLESTDKEIVSEYQAHTTPRNRQAPDRFNIMAYDKHGRPKIQLNESDYQCYECHAGVDDEDAVECNSCHEWFHLLCVGLERQPKSGFECPYCVEDDGLAEEASSGKGGSANDKDYQSDSHSDSKEDDTDDSSRLSQSDDEAETNPFKFFTEVDARQFQSELQADDTEATLEYLLKQPYDKTYQDEDLEDEIVLQRALRLLYAARTGEGKLREKPSIHIKYTHISSDKATMIKDEMDSLHQDLLKFLNPEE